MVELEMKKKSKEGSAACLYTSPPPKVSVKLTLSRATSGESSIICPRGGSSCRLRLRQPAETSSLITQREGQESVERVKFGGL